MVVASYVQGLVGGCAAAITAVLLVQLRKLRPIKWWSVKLWRIHAHAPGSHRVVTLSHSHTHNPATLRSAIERLGVVAGGIITSSTTTSLSLSLAHSWHKHAGRGHNRRVQNTRELAPVTQAGGRVSTVQWLRRNQSGKERHGIGERGNEHCVTSLLLAPSVSLSFYLSLSLSLLSLSLPQVADLNSVRCRAPQVVVLLCRWSSPRTVGRRAALPCAASGQDVGSITPSVVTPC
jgi:hypothetical protein